MKCIVGLGNPGLHYAQTRHNIGFLLIDQILEEYGFSPWSDSSFHAVVSRGHIEGEKVILVKPMTYMNLSGQSVQEVLSYYKLSPSQDLLVLSDDIDMVFGKVRMRTTGSHGGQNGLKDIIHRIGTPEFARIKIGIGRHEQMSVSDWVLSSLSQEELKYVQEDTVPKVREYIYQWITQ